MVSKPYVYNGHQWVWDTLDPGDPQIQNSSPTSSLQHPQQNKYDALKALDVH